jgi:uncharacterized protein
LHQPRRGVTLRAPQMTPSLFTVSVSEIERDEQHRSWEIPAEWVQAALADTEATSTGATGRLTVHLMKNGREFMVRGKVQVQVSLPCARTLEPAIYDLSPELFLMLVQVASAEPGKAGRGARSKNKAPETEDLLDDADAARDTFSGESIQLDPFVREQVVLELPMFPLRSDLRSKLSPAIGAPPAAVPSDSEVDPRLAPLRALREKLAPVPEKASPATDTPNKKK